MTEHEKYEKLLLLAIRLRTAEWDAIKYGGNTYRQQAKLAGRELDKFLRLENLHSASLKKELEN